MSKWANASEEAKKRRSLKAKLRYRNDSEYRARMIERAIRKKKEMMEQFPIFRKLEKLRKLIYTTRQGIEAQLEHITESEKRLFKRVKEKGVLEEKWAKEWEGEKKRRKQERFLGREFTLGGSK